jgi:tellurite resistance protein TerC
VPEIPTLLSLGVILVILAVTIAASLLKVRSDPAARAHAGALPAQADRSEPESPVGPSGPGA